MCLWKTGGLVKRESGAFRSQEAASAGLLLQPGESRQVVLPLDARSFAYFDVKGKRWRADAGIYRVLIGESAEQIALSGAVQLDHSVVSK